MYVYMWIYRYIYVLPRLYTNIVRLTYTIYTVRSVFLTGSHPGESRPPCALRYMTLPEGEDLEVSWEDLEVSIINQWLFLVPLKGGIGSIVHPPIGSKNTTYIPLIVLAFWGVICYRSNLLGEPETTMSFYSYVFVNGGATSGGIRRGFKARREVGSSSSSSDRRASVALYQNKAGHRVRCQHDGENCYQETAFI